MSQEVDSLRAQVTQLQAEIGKLKDTQHKVKAYQACSWFNDEQVKHMNDVYRETKKNKTVDWDRSFRPLDHQYNNMDVVSHPEVMEDVEWQVQTFRGDVAGYSGAEVGIMAYDPKQDNNDVGVVYEIAGMLTMGKPVVAVIPDDATTPLNLMPAIGLTDIIHVSDLADYDFNNILQGTYHGKIY